MSRENTVLSFKIVEGRHYVLAETLLLWLWERYGEHLDLGRDEEPAETREIITEIMEAMP